MQITNYQYSLDKIDFNTACFMDLVTMSYIYCLTLIVFFGKGTIDISGVIYNAKLKKNIILN